MSLPPNTVVPLWRSLAYNVAIAGWTALVGTLWAPGSIFSRRIADSVTIPWTAGALWLAKNICGQTYEIRGAEHIIYQNVMIASKHQSAFEIIVLLHSFPEARFILKKELLWIPIFGQYLWRIGMVPIKRNKRAKILEAMTLAARSIIHQRRPLIIFPEGTRTKAGVVSKYQPGVAVLYDYYKIPILPLAVNTGVYWPKKRTEKMSGTAVLQFLPVIAPGLPMREALKQLQDTVETHSMLLYNEAQQALHPTTLSGDTPS